ncbi:hypothetical protein [Winogradskyella sp. 3972H.M.0a.05]|uniref:hypothetical protein n=1 Tax=Winogradskyella sp. 3972H.M.0a.05 TaxID=2950277 RepID=UPI003399E1BF
MSNKPSFIKFRIIAGIVGGVVCGGIMYLGKTFLDASFTNNTILIVAAVVAVIFAIIVKPKPNPNA